MMNCVQRNAWMCVCVFSVSESLMETDHMSVTAFMLTGMSRCFISAFVCVTLCIYLIVSE